MNNNFKYTSSGKTYYYINNRTCEWVRDNVTVCQWTTDGFVNRKIESWTEADMEKMVTRDLGVQP